MVEDRGGKRPPASQEERPLKKPALPTPDLELRTSSPGKQYLSSVLIDPALDFPDGIAVKTLRSHCRELGFDPWSWN